MIVPSVASFVAIASFVALGHYRRGYEWVLVDVFLPLPSVLVDNALEGRLMTPRTEKLARKSIAAWRQFSEENIATHLPKDRAILSRNLNHHVGLIKRGMTALEKSIAKPLTAEQARRVCSHYTFFTAKNGVRPGRVNAPRKHSARYISGDAANLEAEAHFKAFKQAVTGLTARRFPPAMLRQFLDETLSVPKAPSKQNMRG